MKKKSKYKAPPPRQQNQLLNILALALIAAALAIGDWLTTTRQSPWFFIASVAVGVVIFVVVRRYNSKPL